MKSFAVKTLTETPVHQKVLGNIQEEEKLYNYPYILPVPVSSTLDLCLVTLFCLLYKQKVGLYFVITTFISLLAAET